MRCGGITTNDFADSIPQALDFSRSHLRLYVGWTRDAVALQCAHDDVPRAG